MKVFEDVSREVVTERECVELKCNLCGRKAEHPKDELWEWGGAGVARGELTWHHSIDGEYDPESRDLCYECSAALGRAMDRNPLVLLALLGRTP